MQHSSKLYSISSNYSDFGYKGASTQEAASTDVASVIELTMSSSSLKFKSSDWRSVMVHGSVWDFPAGGDEFPVFIFLSRVPHQSSIQQECS